MCKRGLRIIKKKGQYWAAILGGIVWLFLPVASLSEGPIQEPALAAEFSLENGLKAYLLPYSRPRLTAIVLAIRVGVSDETPETNGLLHLLEHCLLFRQSHLEAEDNLYRLIKKYGMYYNAHTEYDLMFFEICLPPEHLTAGLDLLKKVVYEFNLTEQALDKEKEVLLKELADIRRQPEKVGLSKIYNLAFQNSGYALPVYGDEQVIRRLNLSDLKNWHQKYFTPNNSALVVVGNCDLNELEDSIRNIFSELKPGQPIVRPTVLEFQPLNSSQQIEIKMDVSETYLIAGLIGPNYNHPDRIALDALSEILSGGVYPLLYLAFSSRPNLISSARLHYLTHAQSGLMVITITTSEKNARTTKRLLQNFFSLLPEINYSGNEYLSRTEIGVFDFLLGCQNRFQRFSQKMMEDPLLVAMALGKHLLLGDDSQKINYLEAISSLSPTELRKVARKYFVGGEPVWLVIKPE